MKKFAGHKGVVNSISTNKRGQEMVCSASDDGSLRVWDARVPGGSVKEFWAREQDAGKSLLATKYLLASFCLQNYFACFFKSFDHYLHSFLDSSVPGGSVMEFLADACTTCASIAD